LAPNRVFGIGEVKHCKCRVLIDTEEYYKCAHDRLPQKGMCSESRDVTS